MYVAQLDSGRCIILDATNKYRALQIAIDMVKEGELVARILKYRGKCIEPIVETVVEY